MRVALRVQARSLRGLRDGVPNLLRLFGQYQVRASFFFPLRRDLSGRHLLPAGHVYAVSAEREGLDLLPLMEKLLVMWRGQGGSIRTLGEVLGGVDPDSLPHHQAGWGAVAGGQGQVAMQSIQVPA